MGQGLCVQECERCTERTEAANEIVIDGNTEILNNNSNTANNNSNTESSTSRIKEDTCDGRPLMFKMNPTFERRCQRIEEVFKSPGMDIELLLPTDQAVRSKAKLQITLMKRECLNKREYVCGSSAEFVSVIESDCSLEPYMRISIYRGEDENYIPGEILRIKLERLIEFIGWIHVDTEQYYRIREIHGGPLREIGSDAGKGQRVMDGDIANLKDLDDFEGINFTDIDEGYGEMGGDSSARNRNNNGKGTRKRPSFMSNNITISGPERGTTMINNKGHRTSVVSSNRLSVNSNTGMEHIDLLFSSNAFTDKTKLKRGISNTTNTTSGGTNTTRSVTNTGSRATSASSSGTIESVIASKDDNTKRNSLINSSKQSSEDKPEKRLPKRKLWYMPMIDIVPSDSVAFLHVIDDNVEEDYTVLIIDFLDIYKLRSFGMSFFIIHPMVVKNSERCLLEQEREKRRLSEIEIPFPLDVPLESVRNRDSPVIRWLDIPSVFKYYFDSQDVEVCPVANSSLVDVVPDTRYRRRRQIFNKAMSLAPWLPSSSNDELASRSDEDDDGTSSSASIIVGISRLHSVKIDTPPSETYEESDITEMSAYAPPINTAINPNDSKLPSALRERHGNRRRDTGIPINVYYSSDNLSTKAVTDAPQRQSTRIPNNILRSNTRVANNILRPSNTVRFDLPFTSESSSTTNKQKKQRGSTKTS